MPGNLGLASPGLHADGDPGVLAASADGDILQRYDEDLDAAFEQAREQGDVTPLVQTVKRWWFEATPGVTPAQREFLARVDVYRDEGPPPAEQRMNREEIRARFGVCACTGGSWMARRSRVRRPAVAAQYPCGIHDAS